ncbi:hypothetical protein XENOCAPTIV_009764 [Xenoophorus captivus]|uniref:Uncharacterized protein n=1 Tax=Xenoophorus captivus TaxID=1517983 RepID=A0ABV0QQX0_9TELE
MAGHRMGCSFTCQFVTNPESYRAKKLSAPLLNSNLIQCRLLVHKVSNFIRCTLTRILSQKVFGETNLKRLTKRDSEIQWLGKVQFFTLQQSSMSFIEILCDKSTERIK